MDLMEKELEAARKAAEFQIKLLKDLRTELNSAVESAELGMRHESKAKEYLEKIQLVLSNMESTIAYALGETVFEEPVGEDTESMEALAGKR